MELKLRVHSDATAAIGIAERRGLGRIRHLATTDLWIQEPIRDGKVELLKILGTENPADVLTKYVDKKTMEAALAKLSLEFQEGRSQIAPNIMGTSTAPEVKEGENSVSQALPGKSQMKIAESILPEAKPKNP